MNNVKTFADLFAPIMKEVGPGQFGYQHDIGLMALEALKPKMATESLADQEAVGEGLVKYLMAVESAGQDIGRLGGISYSMALQHADVLGMPVTPENFTTQVSKKNYEVATENLKMLAVIGLSAVIVAGFGYLIFKLLSAEKKKTKTGEAIVKMAEEVEKAVDIFSSLDVNELPTDAKATYVDLMSAGLHPMVVNSVDRNLIMTKGYDALVASVAYTGDISQMEAHRFAAKKSAWLVGTFNKAAVEMTAHVLALAKTIDSGVGDVASVDAAVFQSRVNDTERNMQGFLAGWATENGITVPGGSITIDAIYDTSRMSSRLMPADLIKRIGATIEVPEASEYADFNKNLEKLTQAGKKLDVAVNGLKKSKMAPEETAFLGEIVESFKVTIGELDQLADVVRSEVEALAITYGFRSAAAKKYSAIIFEALKDVDDADLVKKFKDQIAKGAKELPKKVIALETISEPDAFNDTEMAVEAIGETVRLAAVVGGTMLLVGGSLLTLFSFLRKGGESAEKRGEIIVGKLEQHKDGQYDFAEASKYIFESGNEMENGVLEILESARFATKGPLHHSGDLNQQVRKVVDVVEEDIHDTLDWIQKTVDLTTSTSKEEVVEAGKKAVGVEAEHHGEAFGKALEILIKTVGELPGGNQIKDYSSASFKTANDVQACVEVCEEVVRNILSRRSELVSAKEASKTKFNYDANWFGSAIEPVKNTTQQLVKMGDIGTRLEKIINTSKLDADVVKTYKALSPEFAESFDLTHASIDGQAKVIKLSIQIVNAYLKQVNKALDFIGSAHKKMAAEGINWDGDGPQGDLGGDGVDIILQESQAYLELPEYTQAGYRFDPREGYDGSNVMAMEGWATGAKVALGIAAAIGVIGLGAIIASTIMKRATSSAESHATKEHMTQAKAIWEKLEGEAGVIGEEIEDTVRQVEANQDYIASNPQWYDRIQAIRERVERSKKMEVDVNGQSVRVGKVIVDALGGDMAMVVAAKFAEFNRNHPPQSMLDHENKRFPKALNELFSNVVEKPLGALEQGRPAETVLEELNTYIERKGAAVRESIMGGDWGDVEYMLAQVTANWLPQSMHNNNSVEIISSPVEFMTMATSGHNQLLDLNARIAKELEMFVLDDRLIHRFNVAQENSKGSRDATASILRRVEEFKQPFANFVRALRRDQEEIDKLLSFVDRYIKAMGVHGKSIADELADIRREMKRLRDDSTPQ